MRKAIHILSLAVLLPFVSCVSEMAMEQDGVQVAPVSALKTKSVNTAVNALPGTLLVKLSNSAVASFDRGESVEELSELCAEYSAHCSNLFPCKGTALEKKHNLNRWFVLRFDEKVDVTEVAAKAAELSVVETIQFNTALKRAFGSEATAWTPDGYLWYNYKTIFGKDKPKTVFSNSPGVMTYIEGHWDGTMMGDYGYLLDNPGINSGWSNITE